MAADFPAWNSVVGWGGESLWGETDWPQLVPCTAVRNFPAWNLVVGWGGENLWGETDLPQLVPYAAVRKAPAFGCKGGLSRMGHMHRDARHLEGVNRGGMRAVDPHLAPGIAGRADYIAREPGLGLKEDHGRIGRAG